MSYSEPIRAIIDQWHRGGRHLGRFPESIGATVHYIPGGGRILGAAHHGVIVINADIQGTNLHGPVLAHECAHVLMRHEDIHPCLRCPDQSREERRAWKIAALLAIPQRTMDMFCAGTMHARDVAGSCDVPLPFVALRYALLKSDTPMLDAAERNIQTTCWLQWLSERIDPTPAAAASRAPSCGIDPRANGWLNSGLELGIA